MKMKTHLFYSFILICTTYIQSLHAVPTILASSLSCTTPTILSGSVIIELDIDLVMSGMCEPLQAGLGFGPTDTITFIRGANGSRVHLTSVIIPPTPTAAAQVLTPAVWNLSSFSSLGQQCIFDNVELLLDPGTTIMAGTISLRFINGSVCNLQPIA
jgi:hypothetical protein